MKKLKKKIWRTLRKKRPNNLLIFVLAFAVVCALVLVVTHAASPNTSTEPENGSVSGAAGIGNDSSASGGKFLQFGGGQTTVNVPDSIASDCSVDVAPELNSWIASLSNNTTAVLKKNACYLTEDKIAIQDKSHFTLKGNNATFRRTLRLGNQPKGNHLHILITGSDNIEVDDLTITGEKPDTEGYNSGLEAQHGFAMYGLLNGVFDNVRISSIWGDCFYFNSGTSRFSQFITIKNSYCHQTGRHGAAFLAANDITITHSTIENNHRENFDFEPYGTGRGGANNVTIDHNVIGPASQLLISASAGSPELKNLVFSDNIIHRRFNIVLESANNGLRRGPLTISNNTSDVANIGNALSIDGFDDVTITGNHAIFDSVNNLGDPNAYFVQFYYSRRMEISNNIADGALSVANIDANSSDFCGSGNTPAVADLPACGN